MYHATPDVSATGLSSQHMRRRFAVLLLAGFVMPSAQSAPPSLPPRSGPPSRVEAIYRAVEPRVDTGAAMAIVTEMAPLWRLAGNPQFDQALEWIDARLRAAGIATRFDTIASTSQGWEMRDAVLRLDDEAGEVVLSKAQDRVPLAINSFPTTAGGRVCRLVDAGRGADAKDYEGLRVAGAVVLADGPIGSVWNQAVKDAVRPASSPLRSPRMPGPRPRPRFCSGGPSRTTRSARHSASRRRREPQGDCANVLPPAPCEVHVRDRHDVPSPARSHTGRGVSRHAAGRTTASSSSRTCRSPAPTTTQAAAARWSRLRLRCSGAIAGGPIPPPARTLTLLWGDEIRASDAWIDGRPARAARVVAMMSLDMTGEDTDEDRWHVPDREGTRPCGGARQRPSDPHTEWGASEVDRALVRGTFLNDLHLAVALRRARDTGWVVRTNPVRGRQRSHVVHATSACRRSSTGTSPTATITPTSTPSTR